MKFSDKKIETAIIIAGGSGTRLYPMTKDMPKSMIEIGGKPLLEHNIEWLKKHGVKNIIIGVAHKKEKIIDYFKDGKGFGVNIIYSEHDVNDGTADAFRKAIKNANLEDKYFYALNADQLTDFPLEKLFEHHINRVNNARNNPNPLVTLLLINPVCPFGLVKRDDDGLVESFKEKPRLDNYANGGIYVFDIDITPHLSGDIERDTFVKLAEKRQLQSLSYDGFWDTINTHKDFIRVSELFKNKKSKIPKK